MNKSRILVIAFLLISSLVHAQSPIVKNQIGISLNNLIWSNNLGIILNYEVPTHFNKSIKFRLGYLYYANDYVQTVSLRAPIYMEPRINSFGGWEFGGEFKFYRAGKRQLDMMNKYMSFYFDYRNLSGETRALTVPLGGNAFSTNPEEINAGVYKSLEVNQSENVSNFGVKFGLLSRIARISKTAIVLDTYLGLAYQLHYCDYHLNKEDYDGRIYINNLKNGFERSYSQTDLNKIVVSSPVLQFGVDLNLMY